MGYLNSDVIEIDAILTDKGKELLSKGANSFSITQFALADDEIDYRLFDPNNSKGSNYYGALIEDMPILEANPNSSQVMKYKLISLPKNTTRMPVLDIGNTSVTLQSSNQNYVITPTTINYANANSTYGYTAVLSDSDAAIIRPVPGSEVNVTGLQTTSPTTTNSESQSVTVIAHKFEIVAKEQRLRDITVQITIIGNETGGRKTLNLTVKQQNIASSTPLQL